MRALAEADVLARASGEFDAEAAIARQAELWDPEIELDASDVPVLDISGVHRGADAARNWWREWYAAWDTLRFEYELVDAGDRVVLLARPRAARALDGNRVPARRKRVGRLRSGRA